uniref:Uncharacterized protein n=1 Tax=Phlebotomus papatasi TaxID=29031 RepID=A0A1B0GMN5_PHLPP
MRRRKIQEITLNLNDLKEYEVARQERAATRQAQNASSGSATSSGQPSTSTGAPMKPPAKSKIQEIHERIGL